MTPGPLDGPSLQSNRTFDRGVTLAIALAAALLLVAAGVSYRNLHRLNDDARWVAHTYDVIGRTAELLLTLGDAGRAERNFVVTGKEEFLEPYAAALVDIQERTDGLQAAIGDNEAQQRRLEKLRALTAERLALLRQGIDLRRRGGKAEEQERLTTRGRSLMESAREVVKDIEDAEFDLLHEREHRSERTFNGAIAAAFASAFGGLFVLAAFVYVLRRSFVTRMRAASVLHQQREWFRTTLASIGDAVIATDAGGSVTFMNYVAETLTGWPSAEATGRPLDEVFRIVNEETRQAVDNPALRALREGRIVGLANHTILTARDGSERPIDDSAAPINDARGRVRGAVLVFRDISERKRAEQEQAERNRLTALRADVGVILSSGEGMATVLHRCAERLVHHLDLAFARVWTLNEAEGVLELQASAGLYTHLDGPHSRVLVGHFKIGRIAANRQAHLTNSVATDPNVSDPAWAAREGMVAFAGYPLILEDKVVGGVGGVRPASAVGYGVGRFAAVDRSGGAVRRAEAGRGRPKAERRPLPRAGGSVAADHLGGGRGGVDRLLQPAVVRIDGDVAGGLGGAGVDGGGAVGAAVSGGGGVAGGRGRGSGFRAGNPFSGGRPTDWRGGTWRRGSRFGTRRRGWSSGWAWRRTCMSGARRVG